MARADVLEAAPGTTDIVPLLRKLSQRYSELGLVISLAPNGNEVKAQIATEVLETVFTNLFDNSRQNGAAHVNVSFARGNGVWKITVADNGHGVSAANADKIFTPFFTTHRESGGTGLGLGIVRTLLKAYGGDIVLAKADHGAAFVVSLLAGTA
jgi:signal transduction histidine kinase